MLVGATVVAGAAPFSGTGVAGGWLVDCAGALV